MRHSACQTVHGGKSMCISAHSGSSGALGLGPGSDAVALPGLRFGPSALRAAGLVRDAASATCAPWPLLNLGTQPLFLKGFAVVS